MKVAVSIPDGVFERAERLARYRNVSRSQLYADALRLLVDSDARITDQLDHLYGDLAVPEVDGAADEVALRILFDAEW